MYRPKQIIIQNLFSHEYTEYTFPEKRMVMFIGKNGAGKSTINEAITFVITGDVSRGVSKREFIRNGEEYCQVNLVLENKVLNKEIEIIRNNHIKNTGTLKIFENGEELAFESINEAEKYLFNQFGFEKEDFLNYFVIGQGNKNSFFTSTDTKQKEIISRFSNFKPIDKIVEKLKEEIKEINAIKQKHNFKIENINGSLIAYQEQLDNVEETFKLEQQEQLEEVEERIEEIKLRIEKDKKTYETTKLELKTLEEKIKKLPINFDEIEKKNIKSTNEIKNKLADLQNESIEANKLLGELNLQNGAEIECPKCNHIFIPDSELTPSEIKENIEEIKGLLLASAEEVNSFEIRLKKLKNENIQISEEKILKQQLNKQLNNHKEFIENFKTRKAKQEKQITELEDKLEEIGKQTSKAKQKELIAKIEELNKQIEEQNNSIGLLEIQLEEKRLFEYHFSNKGFKSFLAKKSIKNIQDICNWYLQKFNINLQVQISGYTTLKNGDVRDKIEVTVVRNGFEVGLFKKYSGGEQNRVDLCGILTLQRLINNNCEHGKGLDLLVIDECVGYLDTEGQNEIINILQSVDITSILVMHNVDNVNYDKKIYFIKNNGVTKIKDTKWN